MTDPNQTARRKDEHVKLANDQYTKNTFSAFDDLRFVHNSFSEMAVKDADLTTSFAGFDLNVPIYINAMTGGTEMTRGINELLGNLATELGLVIATGSLSAALKDPTALESFRVIRDVNPKGIILANIGAGKSLEDAKRVVDIMEADALQFHLNTPQEIVMPEGDRDFDGWLSELQLINEQVGVPVIVKEVGFGMCQETYALLRQTGVQVVDVSGRGGTNFARIENDRRLLQDYAYLDNWGQTTPESLLEAQSFLNDMTILASGGVRSPLDVVKCLSLGASAVGMSGFFLNLVLRSTPNKSLQVVGEFIEQIAGIMTLLGARDIEALRSKPMIINGDTRAWCEARAIDYTKFAQRR